MANLGMNFVASEVEESEFELLEAGEYTVTIIGSEVKDTKAGNGRILKLEYKIGDTNRKYFDQINFMNANETAQKIGQQTLKKIAEAVGVVNFSDSDVLHNKRMNIVISQKMGNPYTDKFGTQQPARMQNNITSYKPVGAVSQSASAATAAPAAKKNPFAK